MKGILDSVNGRIIQAWMLMLIGLVGYSQPPWLTLPEEITSLIFGIGIGALTASIARPNDGN